MFTKIQALTAATFIAITAASVATPALAAIQCVEGYQIIEGYPHASPFCQDRYLAQIARSRGFRVSDRQVRHSYSTKSDICKAIGSDNRIREACHGYRDEPSWGHRR